MGFADAYLASRCMYDRLIGEGPAKDLQVVVVVPAYDESGFEKSLDSLFHADDIRASIEVICVVNWPNDIHEQDKVRNKNILEEMTGWAADHSTIKKQFHVINIPDIPAKLAGPGYARKTGMDEAIRRFNITGRPDGIICSFDADTTCDPDYFTSLAEKFRREPGMDACNIYFEHPVSGNEFTDDVYTGIRYYELHMRYYLQALRYAGHSNCFHTVGSAFAFRASAYCRQGGMNRRKAGEDFYFLQKFFDIGKFAECNTTRVCPSPRPSGRVAFGTGPAIMEYIGTLKEPGTYHPELFLNLREFLLNLDSLNDPVHVYEHLLKGVDRPLADFLNAAGFKDTVDEILKNSSGLTSFRKRFLRWFNMFRVLKFLNYGRTVTGDINITEAASRLLALKGIPCDKDVLSLLKVYRELDRGII